MREGSTPAPDHANNGWQFVAQENVAMLPPHDEDGERRRRLWVLCASPLFDFWLDEEPTEDDFRAVGRVAKEVGYDYEDIKTIYWSEVVPVILGTWGPMDPIGSGWLEKRIAQRPRLGYWLTWILRPWWGWVAWEYWRNIKKAMQQQSPPARHTELDHH